MIYSIRGTLRFISENSVVLENHGMAWELHVSQHTLKHIDPNNKEAITLLTWLQVSEHGLALYGFSELLEKKIFLALLKVEGIGPKAALKILSQSSPQELIARIQEKNLEELSKLSGIGPKKAQRILMHLENRLPIGKSNEAEAGRQKLNKDIITGLMDMGYTKESIEQALEQISKEKNYILNEEQLPQILREIIAVLSSREKHEK